MIKLRVVGSSPDHYELLLSNKPRGRKGSHSVVIDDKLLAVLQEAVYSQHEVSDDTQEIEEPEYVSRSQPTAVEPPAVAPREIQRRLRAGMTVAQVARSTGAHESYVEQFHAPVVYEREGVIRDAGALSIEKARLGTSGLPLGEAVERNLAARRVRMTDDELARAWSATRQDNHPWVVMFTFPFRGRARKASWRFDQRARELVAVNKLGVDLGWVPESAKQRASRLTVGDATAMRKPARRKAAAKKKPAKRKTSAKRKPAKRKTAVKRKTGARKTVHRKPAAKRKVARKKPTRRTTATRRKTAKRKTAKRKTARRR